jgi:hypothetical protein
MVRRELVLKHGGFNEIYAPGWFDQVEFCQQLYMASQQILFEPTAEFISNANVPLINRLVRDNYERYRSAECHYIRRHFGFWAARITNLAVAIGMLERFAFSLALPRPARKWFLSSLGAYVSDSYIRRLRAEYWQVFRKSLWSNL